LIIIPRFIPLIVHFGQALTPRLSENHPKIPLIEKDIRLYMSGYRGEVTTDFHSQFLDDKNHSIFRGLRLPNADHHFQIDTAILSRKYLLLLETKSHSGDIIITQEQFSRASSFGEKGYKHPIVQMHGHRDQLHSWLESRRLPMVPIIPLPVFSNPSAVIKSTDPAILNHLCKADNLKNKILQLTSSYTKDILTDREIKKISKHLVKDHTPNYPSLQRTYGISQAELIRGIRCPVCCAYRMMRKDRVYVCPHCFAHSKSAYQDALLDYFLLEKATITNREFRDFIGVDSVKTANKMLSLLNLPCSGEKKGRFYHRPDDFITQLEERYHRLK
jgi:hypothetical protein